MQNYARAFRIIRAAFGLKQAELAARVPITASQLSLIEAGKRTPSLRVVNGMANAVGIPPALVSLLASSAAEIDSDQNQHISDLARTLLRMLVSTREESQRSLDLDER